MPRKVSQKVLDRMSAKRNQSSVAALAASGASLAPFFQRYGGTLNHDLARAECKSAGKKYNSKYRRCVTRLNKRSATGSSKKKSSKKHSRKPSKKVLDRMLAKRSELAASLNAKAAEGVSLAPLFKRYGGDYDHKMAKALCTSVGRKYSSVSKRCVKRLRKSPKAKSKDFPKTLNRVGSLKRFSKAGGGSMSNKALDQKCWDLDRSMYDPDTFRCTATTFIAKKGKPFCKKLGKKWSRGSGRCRDSRKGLTPAQLASVQSKAAAMLALAAANESALAEKGQRLSAREKEQHLARMAVYAERQAKNPERYRKFQEKRGEILDKRQKMIENRAKLLKAKADAAPTTTSNPTVVAAVASAIANAPPGADVATTTQVAATAFQNNADKPPEQQALATGTAAAAAANESAKASAKKGKGKSKKGKKVEETVKVLPKGKRTDSAVIAANSGAATGEIAGAPTQTAAAKKAAKKLPVGRPKNKNAADQAQGTAEALAQAGGSQRPRRTNAGKNPKFNDGVKY